MCLAFDPTTFLAETTTRFGALRVDQRIAFADLLAFMSDDERLVDVRHAAYMLATAWLETDKTMRPIAEYGKGKGRKYGRRGRHGGQVPYGRGLVQLTWDANYEKADAKLGLNGALLRNYDLAMDPKIAYRIMSLGMHEGWFTGKKLTDYINKSRCNYVGARYIINIQDRAAEIARYARHFEAALTASLIGVSDDPPRPEPKQEQPAAKPAGFWVSREG
jgi:hypothetical protein